MILYSFSPIIEKRMSCFCLNKLMNSRLLRKAKSWNSFQSDVNVLTSKMMFGKFLMSELFS